MQEEQSLVDYIFNLAPADTYLVIPSIIGGLMMFGIWYAKKFDTQMHFQLNEKKKQFRLGGFYTGLVGFVGGAGMGWLARNKGSMDLESTAFIAFLGGMVAPWALIKVGHMQWELVVKAAKHPLLSSTQYAPPQARALGYAGKELSVVDRKLMRETGSTTAPIDESGLRDWEHRRELILARMLKWWNRQKDLPAQYQTIPTEELEEVHSIFPAIGDVRSLLNQVKSLEGKETQLTLSQKLSYDQMIYSQKEVIEDQTELIDEYKMELERGRRSQNPQYQLTKQVIYSTFGFVLRQLLVWAGV